MKSVRGRQKGGRSKMLVTREKKEKQQRFFFPLPRYVSLFSLVCKILQHQ